jgi:hypothetical protein
MPVAWHHAGVDVDDLYGLPLDRFVPERTALAKELRGAGRREEADAVTALRKPSVAAWAVNQLVRTQRREVSELFAAGDALRGAQAQVLAGSGDGGSLRAAVEQERAAVETLTGAARGLLSSEGHELSPTIIDRVSETLHAAALDDDARAQVQHGRLERELRHVGLGMAAPAGTGPGAQAGTALAAPAGAGLAAAGTAPAPAGAPARRRSKKASGQRAADRAAADRAERERAAVRAAARVAEREARRRLERAERGTKLAQERRDRAAQALSEAEQELQETQRELDEARAQLREAERTRA